MLLRKNPIRFFNLFCIEVLCGALLGYLLCLSLGWTGKSPTKVDPGPVVVIEDRVERVPTQHVVSTSEPDQDGDGMPDTWETTHFLNPDDPEDADTDFDADGLTSIEEYLHQKNPLGEWSHQVVAVPAALQSKDYVYASAINGSCEFVVNTDDYPSSGGYVARPYVVNPGTGVWTEIAPPNIGTGIVYAHDLNDLGTVALEIWDQDWTESSGAFRYGDDSYEVATDSDDGPAVPYRLNNFDEWIGFSLPNYGPVRSDGSSLSEMDAEWLSWAPTDINDMGVVLGTARDPLSNWTISCLDFGDWFFSTGLPGTYPGLNTGYTAQVSGGVINKWIEFAGNSYQYSPTYRSRTFIYDGSYHESKVGTRWVDSSPAGIDGYGRVLSSIWNYPSGSQLTATLSCRKTAVPISALVPGVGVGGAGVMAIGGINVDGAFVISDNPAKVIHLIKPSQDEDGDGMSDDWEEVNGLKKNFGADATVDSDGDGISNLGEFRLRSNPNLRPAYDDEGEEIDLRPGIDTDGDGIPNVWEWQHGFDYEDPSDAAIDSDHDGSTNLDEFHLGTDPRGAPYYSIQPLGPFSGATGLALSLVALGDGEVTGEGASDVKDIAYFSAAPSGGGSGGVRPASWSFNRSSGQGELTFHTSHGSQNTTNVAVAANGAAMATYWSSPMVYHYWSSPGATPIALSGAAAQNNIASLGNAKLSPSGTYLVAMRSRASGSAYEPIIWKMPQTAGQTVAPVILAPPAGASFSSGQTLWVNDHGYAAAVCSVSGVNRPVIWKLNAQGNALASTTIGAVLSGASQMNVMGISNGVSPVVVGSSVVSGSSRATVWNHDGTATNLGTLGGSSSSGLVISPAGKIGGYAVVSGGMQQPFLAEFDSASTSWVVTPQGSAGYFVAMAGVTDAGEILGRFRLPTDVTDVPALWSKGRHHPLESAISPTSGYRLASVRAISPHGAVLATAWKDGQELRVLLTPDRDVDGDGLPDDYERLHGFDSLKVHVSTADADGDGLSDFAEYSNGTDPRDRDTDSDGMSDKWEVDWGLLPLDASDADRDPDGDTLPNSVEFKINTVPTGIYRLKTMVPPASSGYPSIITADDGDNLAFSDGQSLSGSIVREDDLIEDYYKYSDFVLPSGATSPLQLPSFCYKNVHDEYWSVYWTTEDYASVFMDPVEGVVNAEVNRNENSYDGVDYHYGQTTFLVPDAAGKTDEEDWIPWSEVQEDLGPYEVDYSYYDENNNYVEDIQVYPGQLVEGEELNPSANGVSPNGRWRIHGTSLGEVLVLDQRGDFRYRLPNTVYWQRINNDGVAIALTNRNVPAANGVPAYQAPEISRRDQAGSVSVIPVPHTPGVSVNYGMMAFSTDQKVLLRETLYDDMAQNYYFKFWLFDLNSKELVRVASPGFNGESVYTISPRNGYMPGNGTKPFMVTSDGTCLRLEALRVRTGSGSAHTTLPAAGYRGFGAIYISSDGKLMVQAVDSSYQATIVQLLPENDADADGMSDDWEKYWSQVLLATLPSPSPATTAVLQGGNLDPDVDYGGNGATAGSSFFSYAEEDERDEVEPEEVVLAVQSREASGYLLHTVIGEQDPMYLGAVGWGASSVDGPWSEYLNQYDDEIDTDTVDNLYLLDLLDGDFGWNDIPLYPGYSSHGWSVGARPSVHDVESDPGDPPASEPYDQIYSEAEVEDARLWLWNKWPNRNPVTRYYAKLRDLWSDDEGTVEEEVLGVYSLSIPPSSTVSTTSIELNAHSVPGVFAHSEAKELRANLEVVTPDINIASPEGPPSHRKISLFASPLKDGSPAGTPESDTPAEEAYVDAFDRSLKFNTSFAWIPQGSSELPLGVTLSYNPSPITVVRTQTLDSRGKPNGFRDSFGHNSGVIAGVFGAGFSSNLSGAFSASAELTSVKDPVTGQEKSKIERYKVDVVDSDGVPYRFTSKTLQSFQEEPGPVAAAAGQDVNLAWESGAYTHLVLTHKHGKKCRFQWAGPAPVFPSASGMSGGYTSTDLNGVTIRGTARLVEVHDRFGNKLVYQDVATGRRISHFHKNATQASGAIEIGMTSGLVSSIKDPRNQITRFYYETKKIGQTALKLPVLTKVVLPDGGVRRFGLHLDFRKPTTHNTALPQPHDPTSIFTEGNLKPRKKKKWLTDDSIESAVAPYLTLISDPSGRTTQFSYDEPTGIDSAQQVHIKATVDFSEYDDIDGNEVFNQALKDSIIASAKLEASPDIVEEMAERGYFKLPTPRENQPMGSPYQDDPYNSEPYENAEGIYFRSGLMSVPAVKKVVSSDINGDGSPEVVEIAQQDNMLKFLTTPNGANPDVSSGVPASQQQANARPQVDLRVTTVTDGIGSTVYRFGDAMMISYSEETPPANPDPSQVMQVQPQLDDIPAGCHMAALIVRKLAIERAGTKETYYFNPRAGMALDAAIDASGNMIRYHYTDPYPQAAGAAALTMAGVAMPGGDTQLQKFHSDPTSETRYKGNVLTGIDGAVTPVTRSFAYTGPYRLQTRVVDERGVLTVQELKDNVLRRLETIYPNVNVGTQPIRQEEWKYDDARFPSFVTEHRVKKLGSSDPTWVTDLVKQYEADANGRIWKEHVVLPTGNLTTIYTYDGNGNKTTVTTPRGLTTGFIYDSMNRIERIIYQDLKTKEFDYDKAGRKVADIDENGYTTTFRYSPGGFLLETRRHMADDDDPTPDDLVTKTVFDSRGRAVGAIDANGNVTTTDYDTLDRPVRVIDAKGGESQFHYDLTKNAGGSIFSGSSFKPTRTRDALGYVTEVTYDYRYMPVKVAKEYQLPTNTTGWQTRTLGPAAVTETVYDNLGNATDTYVKRTSGAALGSDDTMHTHVDFDALGRPWLTTVEPNHATMRHETETQFTSTGLAWKTIEFRNISVLKREFEREFDAAGREVKAWAPAALTGIINKATTGTPIVSALTQTAYDADGNVSQVTDPLGRVTDFHYNNRNRKWKEELPAVEDYDQTPAVMTRPVTVSTFDGVGNVLTVTDPRGTVTKSVFDRAYRATHAYAAFGTAVQTVTSTQYDRNGNTLCVIDQNGNATRNAYDALNRLIGTSVNPTTGNPGWPQTPGSGDIVVANVHDAKGNLIAVADGSAVKSYLNGSWVLTRTSGHVTEFDYDGLNRKVATRWDAGSSLQKQESSSHDAVAMVSRTDAANRVTQYAYDALFRLTTTTYVGDTAQNHTRYYKGANPIPASGPGPQTAVHYGNGSDLRDVTYSLNRLNQVTSERSGGVFHYHNYDIAGNRLLTRHYNRTGITQIRAVVTEYDALNRAKKIHETTRSGFSVYPFVVSPATDKTTQYAYDLSGNTRFKSVPNGQRTTTTYDRLGRKMVMSTLDAVGGLIAAFDYSTPKPGSLTDPSGYDNAGNVRHVVETYSDLSTRTVKNDYDCTHRLTRESLSDSAGEVITEYRYDAANNRIEKEVTGGNTPGLWSFIYGNITNGRNTNQLVSYFRPSDAATLSFTYDAHGNRSARHKNGSLDTEYSYDRENRLLKHKLYGSVQRDDDYVYDFRSRRVVRDESGASNGQGTNVEVSFSGGTSVQEYAPGATTPTVEYVRGSDWGGGVGGILYTIRGGAPSYNVYNSRGDVVSRTDSTGDVTWQAAYEAFGTRTKEVGSTQERQTANTKDEDLSGLLNEGMRYRDLEAGIFLTRDPAGFVDGPNTYTYVRQNPWTSFDPLGLWGWKNLLSTVLDCVPVVSTIKSAVELVAGRDVITGEPINRAEAAVSLAASFTPGGKMAVKAAIKGAKIAEKVMDAVDTAETAVAVVEAAATGDVGTIVEAVGEAAISRVGHRKKGEGGDPSGTSQRDQKPANEAICTKEGGGCFVAGTPVHTPEGFERIENIEVGDQVWSYNLETEQWEASEVTRTFTHSFKGELVTVSYDGGSVVATDNHPFWVVSGDDLGSRPQPEESGEFHWTGGGAWVCAGDLREGDVLLLREGDSRTTLVASLDFREVETTVYNFEVRGLHNYAVSNGGILVHNNCDGKAGVYIATNDTLNERYVGSSVDVPARIADPDHAQADLLSHPDTKTEFVPVDMGGLAEQGDKRRTLNTAEQYEMDDRGITPKTPGVRNVIRARAEKKMDSSEKQYGVRSRMGKARPLKKDSDNEEKDDD